MWLCKRDLSKECKGNYKDCTDCVLDKIMTEIRNIEYLSCPQPDVVLNDVLQIIDKYKVESEEKE